MPARYAVITGGDGKRRGPGRGAWEGLGANSTYQIVRQRTPWPAPAAWRMMARMPLLGAWRADPYRTLQAALAHNPVIEPLVRDFPPGRPGPRDRWGVLGQLAGAGRRGLAVTRELRARAALLTKAEAAGREETGRPPRPTA